MAIPQSSNVNLNWDNVNNVEEVVAIHKALCGTLQTAREIDNKIQEWGNKLENRRARTEAVADAIALNDSKEVKSCIHRAVTPAHQLLQAMADTTRMLTNLNLAKANNNNSLSLSLMMKFAWEIAEKVKLVKSNSCRVAALLHNAVRASNACRRRLGTGTFSSRKLNDCALAIRSNANADAVFNAMNVLLGHVEDALYQALIHSINLPLPSHSHSHSITNTVAFLREHGRARKCVKIYWDIRVRVLTMNFLDTLVRESERSSGVVHAAEWKRVEAVVNEWIRDLRLLVCEFLHREKTAADMLFQGFDRGMWLQAFAHALLSRFHHHDLDFIIGKHLLVFEFEQAVASSSSSRRQEPTRLFKLLDMFEGILDVDEQLHNNIFEGRDCCRDFRLHLGIAQLQTSLASACINTLACFVKKIEEETSLPSNGGVLKITSCTVDYVRFLVGRYESAVKKVLVMRGQGLDLRKAVVEILEALEKNIEEQQRASADKGHGHLFLMNNYWYMLKRCRDSSELALVLGDTWLKERGRWINQNAAAYYKHQWAPLIRHLNRHSLAPGSNSNSKGLAKKLFKQRLTLFNAHFENVHQQHSHWTVTDKELRDATLVNVTQLLVPAYTNFVNTYARLLHGSKHVAKYIKYTPEKIEEILVDLFSHDSQSLANFGCNQI